MRKPIRNQWHIKTAESLMRFVGPLTEKWTYDYGVVWRGFEHLYALTGDRRYLDYIKAGIDSFIGEDGSIRGYDYDSFNLDHVNNGKELLYLYRETGEAKYWQAAQTLRRQLGEQPRTDAGGFWHKQIYPYQMWLDGIHMASPFYLEYSLMAGDESALHDAAHQAILCYDKTYDPAMDLNRHVWDEKCAQPWADKATGWAPHAWGRAMGWYVVALADMLELFPKAHADYARLLEIFQLTCRSLLDVQRDTGVWMQVLDCPERPGNFAESSCTALFTYALAKGIRLGLLPKAYLTDVRFAYAGLVTQFVHDMSGKILLTCCCQSAGLGGAQARDGSFAYYLSEPAIADDLKGLGAFLQAACEVEGRMGL